MEVDNSRQVVAVVTDAYAPFHRDVIDGLLPHFQRAGYGTLCVAGRDVSQSRFNDTETHQIGSLGSRLNIAGAVIVSGALPPGASERDVARFARELTSGPVVSLGSCLPGLASVTIDWEDAIDGLVAHMMADSRRQRFVFIRGYAGDPHTVERERGFRAGMAAAGHEVDEKLIISGDYSTADSMSAVARLIAEGHRFDGVIAANDDMAVGAVAALAAANISVPESVTVSGFDNSRTALTCVPKLTTARLDTGRLTQVSAQLLIESMLCGSPPDPKLVMNVESSVIVRRSSGLDDPVGFAPEALGDVDAVAEQFLSTLEPLFAPPNLDLEWLTNAIATTMLSGDDTFACAVDIIEASTVDERTTHDNMNWWRHTIEQLFRLTAGGDIASEAARAVAPGIAPVLDQIRRLDLLIRPLERLAATRTTAENQLQERLLMRLAGCSDVASLWSTLRTGLRSLGMTNAWVAVNDNHAAEPSRADMQLLFSLDEGDAQLGDRFARSHILPHRFARSIESDLHVLVPLRVDSSDVGYMILEPIGEKLLGLEAIASSVSQVWRHVGQVTDLKERAEQLRHANTALDRMARFDSLTGLPNRQQFLERLDQDLAQRSAHQEVAVMYFDLDGFKQVNDTLGHETGDSLLRILAQRVQAELRHGDTFARVGGDEFTIIASQPEGATRASRLSHAVLSAVAKPCGIGATEVNVSASLGVAYAPRDGATVDEIIRNADAAMYASKARGKNRVTTFAPELARMSQPAASLKV